MNGKINEVIAAKAVSPNATATGLGVQLGDGTASIGTYDRTSPKHNGGNATNDNPAVIGSPYQYKQQDIANAQSKPFFRDPGAHLSKTAPLVQQPFVFPVHVSASKNVNKFAALQSFMSEESGTSSFYSEKPDDALHAVLYITPSDGGSEGSGRAAPGIPIIFTDDEASEMDWG